MRRALELAERGRGHVEPNPLVGAVVVHDGQVVGEGWHEKFGQAHAEINALAASGDAVRGATLCVTLEPCCHHGKTPPCTDAIVRSEIRRVVAAMEDPFPQVAGRGAEALRAAGLAVEFGICAELARRQNAPYLKLVTAGRPYVHAKWAMSLDGKIATRTGDSKWISNEASRRIVHGLRGRMDGILVGINTALTDDPLLTARPPGPRVATRVVLDSKGRLPVHSHIVRTARDLPTLVATTASAPETAVEMLRDHGCEVIVFPGDAAGHLDLCSLLTELGRRRWTNLLIEGGAAVLGSLLDAKLIDEVHAFLAPALIGGSGARGPIGGAGAVTIEEAMRFAGHEVHEIDGDAYWHGWF